MLNEMSNDFQKLLKLINMYEINDSGCQVLHVDIQKNYFFFSWMLLPLKFKQNSLFCSMIPRKGIFSSQGDWDVTEYHLLQPIACLILAKLCHSWSAAEGGTQVRDSNYLLQVPEDVTSLKQ